MSAGASKAKALDLADPLRSQARAVPAAGRRHLSRRQFAGTAAQGGLRRARAGRATGMGRRPDPQLERGRLVVAHRHAGRPHRPIDRRRRRRDRGDGHDLDQYLQGAACRPRAAARASRHPGRARQLSDRPLHRRGCCGIAPGLGASPRSRQRRPRRHDRRADGRRADQPCRLSHRRVARHGSPDQPSASEGRPCPLGPLPQRRRGADRARRARRRFRHRLHLQVPERRPRRAGLHLRQPASPRGPRPAAVRLVGARGSLRHGERLSAGRRHPPPAVRHPAHPVAARARRPRSMCWTTSMSRSSAPRALP